MGNPTVIGCRVIEEDDKEHGLKGHPGRTRTWAV